MLKKIFKEHEIPFKPLNKAEAIFLTESIISHPNLLHKIKDNISVNPIAIDELLNSYLNNGKYKQYELIKYIIRMYYYE